MDTETSLLILTLTATALVATAASAADQAVSDQAAGGQAITDQTAIEPAITEPTATESSVTEPAPAQQKIGPKDEHISLSEEGEPLVDEQFISEPVFSRIKLGLGYVSDDAYRFGRYNGLQTEGPFLLFDISSRKFYEDGRFWSLEGTGLGLESRYLRLEGGVQGKYTLFLEYDELPDYKNNTVTTPFSGIGSNNLTLEPGFDINTNLDASLGGFELHTKRERIATGISFIPRQRWQFALDLSHENKEGVDVTGAALTAGSSQIVGNTTTSLLPEPVDYDTDKVNASMSYISDSGQLELSYHMSLFDNASDSLNWQNPFNPLLSAGSISLAPDNEFHQLALSGGYYLPYKSHFTGLLSVGRMTQNQQFQDYTVNPAASAAALPRASLDGEVWLATAQLKLASRPINKLRVSAELRYNERDNRTPVETYNYVVLDSDSFTATATNRPYSYKNNRIKLDANYRFNAITSLYGGYKYDEMKRDYSNAEREKTEEDTLFAKWKIKAHSTVDLTFSAETGNRAGSDYNPLLGENPALRKYNLADRERDTLGASIDFMATDRLFFSFRADYNKDDYKNSTIGLTEATQPVYTVDFSYQPRLNITTYGYFTHENIRSSQAGFDVSPSATTDWEADFDDSFDTAGIGAKWTELGRWDVGADLVYSKSSGSIEMKDLFNPGTEDQYPDSRTSLSSIKLWTTYEASKQLTYKLGYWYERYEADNWAIDGLQAFDPTVVEGTLLLGNETLDYDVHVVTASASYRF